MQEVVGGTGNRIWDWEQWQRSNLVVKLVKLVNRSS